MTIEKVQSFLSRDGLVRDVGQWKQVIMTVVTYYMSKCSVIRDQSTLLDLHTVDRVKSNNSNKNNLGVNIHGDHLNQFII